MITPNSQLPLTPYRILINLSCSWIHRTWIIRNYSRYVDQTIFLLTTTSRVKHSVWSNDIQHRVFAAILFVRPLLETTVTCRCDEQQRLNAAIDWSLTGFRLQRSRPSLHRQWTKRGSLDSQPARTQDQKLSPDCRNLFFSA